MGADLGRRLLDEGTVGAHLRDRGLGRDVTTVELLGGGISNVVLGVVLDGRPLVVKQALPRLRVADEWLADQERAVTEAEALRLCGELTPAAVPEVLDVDTDRCVMVLERAPRSWDMWKTSLMRGEVDLSVASALGTVVGTWHARTAGAELHARFSDGTAFDQLRVDPYHRTVARRRPEVAEAVELVISQLVARRTCLVHGDLSPKNVLVGPPATPPARRGGPWVIDAEVAHLGNPAFDVAFLWCHLVLKAVHLPAQRTALRECAQVFVDAYEDISAAVGAPPDEVTGQLAVLLLARVDGKSPAEYLTGGERDVVRTVGDRLLADALEGAEPPAVWDHVAAVAG